MDKAKFKQAIEELNKDGSQRNFTESYDIIVTLKDINLKSPEEQVDFYLVLNHGIGKKKKVCGLVGPELSESAKAEFDKSFTQSEFEKLDKKEVKKLASEYDFFVAQANIMPKVAQTFGRILGPRNKMPNPKAGCVVPPKANLKVLAQRLASTVRLKAKTAPMIQAIVGSTAQDIDVVAENYATVFDQIVHHLPKEENNVKSVFIKRTMSKAVKVE